MLIRQSGYQCLDFAREIEEEGFTFLSKVKARKKGYYPNPFPDYPDLKLSDLKEDEIVTVRAFFKVGERIDSGLMDVQIEFIDGDEIWANILTELPETFPLAKGTSLTFNADELLYCSK